MISRTSERGETSSLGQRGQTAEAGSYLKRAADSARRANVPAQSAHSARAYVPRATLAVSAAAIGEQDLALQDAVRGRSYPRTPYCRR